MNYHLSRILSQNFSVVKVKCKSAVSNLLYFRYEVCNKILEIRPSSLRKYKCQINMEYLFTMHTYDKNVNSRFNQNRKYLTLLTSLSHESSFTYALSRYRITRISIHTATLLRARRTIPAW